MIVMKKKATSLIDLIKYEYLEFIAFATLILWAISPCVEIILKHFFRSLYSKYFSLCIYIVGIVGFVLYTVYLIKKIKDKKVSFKKCIPHLFILVLWIISIIATILSSNPKLSLLGEGYRKEGLIVYTLYIGFILLSSIIKDKKYINRLFTIMIIIALFVTIMPLFGPTFTYTNFFNYYFNLNHYGYFLMVMTSLAGFKFLSANNWTKYFYIISYIILLYMLIMNNTFGCYLALLISLIAALIYCIVKKTKIMKAIIVLLLFISLSIINSNFNINIGSKKQENTSVVSENVSSLGEDISTILKGNKDNITKVGSGRGVLWMAAIDYILMHPLIGGGFESLQKYYYSNRIFTSDRPHNIILHIAASIGIPGAMIYLSFIIFLAIATFKRINKDGTNIIIYFTAMSYFISSQFVNSMFYTSPYFVILLGFLIGIYTQDTKLIKTKKKNK
jgi:O-antigen ligase